MTREEQNKILDAKTESHVNQYKVHRLNAEISAFSNGDLNKYEFLKRIDLNYKPNALDKARFEFSPLGRAFNEGLDKTIPNYREEGIIKLLKEIRDNLADYQCLQVLRVHLVYLQVLRVHLVYLRVLQVHQVLRVDVL